MTPQDSTLAIRAREPLWYLVTFGLLIGVGFGLALALRGLSSAIVSFTTVIAAIVLDRATLRVRPQARPLGARTSPARIALAVMVVLVVLVLVIASLFTATNSDAPWLPWTAGGALAAVSIGGGLLIQRLP